MTSESAYIESPFVTGSMITDPAKFWGRKKECREILTRVSKMESSSIVGPRRIGKSSLAYYIYKTGAQKLGPSFEFIWLDGQSNHTASLSHFLKSVKNSSSLVMEIPESSREGLINFEDAVKAHPKKIVLFINEFELLTDIKHQAEFGVDFFNTLRLLAEQSYCSLVTTSSDSIKELCKHVLGVSSPDCASLFL